MNVGTPIPSGPPTARLFTYSAPDSNIRTKFTSTGPLNGWSVVFSRRPELDNHKDRPAGIDPTWVAYATGESTYEEGKVYEGEMQTWSPLYNDYIKVPGDAIVDPFTITSDLVLIKN